MRRSELETRTQADLVKGENLVRRFLKKFSSLPFFDLSIMFLYSPYPVKLSSLDDRPWLLPLDTISVARSLTVESQRTLSSAAPFGALAFRTLHEPEYLKSLMKKPELFDAKVSQPYVKTRAVWQNHISHLQAWNVLEKTFCPPRICVSRYFAVPKNKGDKMMARSIFSGAHLSSFFVRPPPVNLPALPLMLLHLQELTRGKRIFMISCDLRHFFHQIEVGVHLYAIFTIFICGLLLSFVVLPMGWSYSPRIAQCYSWCALFLEASADNGLIISVTDFLKNSPEHPPGFLLLHNHQGAAVGLIVIWYDNFIAWSTDEKIASSLMATMHNIRRRFNLIWGEKKLWSPKQLAKSLLAPATDEIETPDEEAEKVGVALGLQFAWRAKRGREEDASCLLWRMKPKTARKAAQFRNLVVWSCRQIAALIGSRLWQVYASGQSFVHVAELLDLSSRVGTHASRNSWSSQFALSVDDMKELHTAIDKLTKNPWLPELPMTSVSFQNLDRVCFLASDATKTCGAWVRYHRGSRVNWCRWSWSSELGDSIFLLELRAAVNAIKTHLEQCRDGIMVIILDNTAAAAVLRSRYSKTQAGKELMLELDTLLTSYNIFLIVSGIPGIENDADTPSREENPVWNPIRLEKTWENAQRSLTGCERIRLNPTACWHSHILDEKEREVPTESSDGQETQMMEFEDEDCRDLITAVSAFRNETDLSVRDTVSV